MLKYKTNCFSRLTFLCLLVLSLVCSINGKIIPPSLHRNKLLSNRVEFESDLVLSQAPLNDDSTTGVSSQLKDIQYHGTTTIAFINQDSVILCVDSKSSMGDYVGSRTVKKMFAISDKCVATMAGGAADCEYWIRHVAKRVKNIEFEMGSKLRVSAIARMFASILRSYRGKGE